MVWLAVACQSPQVDFNQDIRPILNKNCVSCHGGVKRNGELGLSFRDEALKGGESGLPAIVPGDADASEMMVRILHQDEEYRMPLDAPPLSDEEIDLLTRWIESGAEWDTHWAYRPVQEPEVPRQSGAWGQHPVDAYIRTAQQEQGLKPNEPAPFNRLARRVSLDLTGLPADPGKLAQLAAAPDGYTILVDSLLESPAFGEHWASLWLDLARYADSKGYEKDSHRDLWRYRDWVIRAFNADMPYDSFTLYQLGGDLLPEADTNALLATAFHRSAMTNTEGGTEDEAFRLAAVMDRVNTTFSVWQGTTMECVQCHGHPYDPFRQIEYYEALDFFNQTQDNDLFSDFPWLETFTPKQIADIDRLTTWLDSATNKISRQAKSSPVEKISNSFFPTLNPLDCDDFHSVIVYPDGGVANWSNNLQRLDPGPYFVRFNELNLSEVSEISFHFAAAGDKGSVEFRLDSLDGKLWASMQGEKTGKIRSNEWGEYDTWKQVRLPVTPVPGNHDVFIVLKNPTQAIPEGIVVVKDWRLGPPPTDEGIISRMDTLHQIRKGAVRTPYMRARQQPHQRITRVFDRGNWLTQTDTVGAEVPDAIATWPAAWPKDRAHFAKWLCRPDNPLTARVWVNRIWEQIFGRGLVETSEDFGTQGNPPSHPELLDWLAWDMMHTQAWHLKPFLRSLVMTRTYQLDSEVPEEQLEKDPRNIYLARAPRVRLSAEMIRDQALAVSDLLSSKMHGRSVMPPQPDGIWKVIYSGKRWETPTGPDRYRRAVYTYWRRSSPYPSFTTFDSPSREICVVRRIRTNTPLQALVTLNDPVYTEAASALANKMWHAASSDSARIAWGYHQALARSANDEQMPALMNLLTEARAHYEQDPLGAVKLARCDLPEKTDLAALTVVANAIMNLDGFITKE